MHVTGRSWRAVAAAAVVVLAAGCGNAVSEGGSGGSVSGKTVKIGMSSILSGPAATAGTGTDAGVKAYLEMVNARGGVNGYTFTYDEQDNAYDPAKAATVARNLINDKVFTIVSEGTEPLKATAPPAEAAGIPVFTEATGEILTPPAAPYQHTYGVNPSYAGLSVQGAKFILENLHLNQAGLVYLNNNGETIARDAFPAYFNAHGGTVVDTEAIQVTTNDYSPFAQKLKQSGAPVVYAFVLDSQLPSLQKAADAIGYHPKWVTWFDPYTPGYLKLAGDLATGVYVSLFETPLDQKSDPNVQEYLAAMQKYSPAEIDSQPATQGWTFGTIIVKGIEQATSGGKELTADGFNAALRDIDHESLGLIPSITYNDQTHAGATKAAYYSIKKDGTLQRETPYTDLPTG